MMRTHLNGLFTDTTVATSNDEDLASEVWNVVYTVTGLGRESFTKKG
jgi:hypothetical protein